MKCLDLQDRGTLDVVAARVPGRDVSTGVASGIAATAASLYVSVEGAVICAVISAPAWVPPTAAVTAAIGIGYVVTKTRAVSIGIELGFPRGAKRRSLGGRFSFWDALRRRIGQFVRRLSTEVAPNSSLMQDILQHDRNPL